MSMRKLAVATAIATIAGTSHAGPDSFRDARSFAMGGTGVAAARSASASFFNPALLSVRQNDEHDDFSLTFPSINARVADDEEVIDQVDTIQDQIDALNNALQNFDANPNTTTQQAVLDASEALEDSLVAVDEDAMRVDAGLGFALNIPSQTLAVGLFMDATVSAAVQGDFSDDDQTLLDDLQAAVGAGDQNAIDSLLNNDNAVDGDLTSQGRVIGAAQAELGISLAKQFDIRGNRLALGVSPKFVEIRTFDYQEEVDNFDDNEFDAADQETSDSFFNLDLGAAYQFGQADQWTAGVSVRNLIPMDVETVNDREVEVNPLLRAGIAHSSEWHTLTVDLDLTKNEAFSFEDDTQWLAVGGEFDVYDTLQLRAGARHNLAGGDGADGIEEDSQLTAGVGFSPLGARIEISGLVGGDGEYGASAELGVNF